MLDNNKQKYKMVHINETCKSTEISDAFNRLRYKVEMTSYDVINDGRRQLAYQIQVINYFYGPEPLIIYERPAIDEPLITDSKVAVSIFEECVKNYTSLVKAETREYRDIDIYREQIGYKETCPACCATCKWRKIHVTPKNYIAGVTNTCYCTNPDNCRQYEFDIQRTTIDSQRRQYINDNYGCRIKDDDNSHNVIYPKVTMFGVCDNYTKIDRPLPFVNGDNIVDLVDGRIDRKLQDERLLSV